MTIEIFEEILKGERPCIFTRAEFWRRTVIGPETTEGKESGYHVQIVSGSRMSRATASKRVPFTEGSDVSTRPFGYRATSTP